MKRVSVRSLPGPRAAVRRVAAGIGLEDVIHLERRVADVAVAVEENAALAVPLAARVAELERALVGPLEERHRFMADHGMDA